MLLLKEDQSDTIDLAHQIQNIRIEHTELKQLMEQQDEIIKRQQKQQNRIEELYKLHMKSLREIEKFIKVNEVSNQKKHTYL